MWLLKIKAKVRPLWRKIIQKTLSKIIMKQTENGKLLIISQWVKVLVLHFCQGEIWICKIPMTEKDEKSRN